MAMVRKQGIAVSISDQSIFSTPFIMNTPTMIRAGAVAAEGTMPATGARITASRNRMPVVMEVRPVRPPSSMPVEDSTKVVTVEVPSSAPVQVAIASAIRARSPPGKLPFSSSMPALPAVPSRVPTVSKQSQMAKVMIAVRKGTTPPAERAPEKSSLKATSPNASPIPATVKLSGMVV